MKEKTTPTMKVIVLSGFLGSGKTTLLKHILTNKQQMKVGVIVNDMAELNIDADLIKQSGLVQVKEEFVQIENGCICCTLREDLYKQLLEFKHKHLFEYVVIESTGISEPLNVAETFYIEYEPGKKLADEGIELIQCITVLDISQVFHHLTSDMLAVETDSSSNSPYEGTLAQLFIDQIEFANTIILNKMDLMKDQKERIEVDAIMKSLNPKAHVIESTYSKVNLKEIFGAKRFNIEEAITHAGWLQIMNNGTLDREAEKKYIASELETYKIHSFVYRRRKPFDPEKLVKLIDSDYLDKLEDSHIIRSKGFFWLVHNPNLCYHWEQAGVSLNFNVDTGFFAALDEKEWEHIDEEGRKSIMNDFEGKYGDRRQEIVFIGLEHMKQEDIEKKLDECLVDDKTWEKIQQIDIETWPTFLYPSAEILENLPFAVVQEEEGEEKEMEE